MTRPKLARIADIVRAILPSRFVTMPQHEESLAVHLRGNAQLYESLIGFIKMRIDVRASQPVPTDPVQCKAHMERDHEIRVLLNRLEFIYRSPVAPMQDDGEPPA